MVTTNGIAVESASSPSAIPVTDVGVTYDGAALVLTLPGYQTSREVERWLKLMCARRTAYEYRCHAWRNAGAEREQRDL